VSERPAASRDARAELAGIYDGALPYVYGYLLSRCAQVAVAEDLTAETLLAAVDAVRRDLPPTVSTAWLIGVARHKLVDHWRRQEREERGLRAVAAEEPEHDDPWDAQLDGLRAQAVLDQMSAHHRSALTLRYLDDLPVADVAALLDRSVHATEALLVRARAAFRRLYQAEGSGDV
jgi:RNA polymerase sigma-70 factor, ECF subfamily